MKNDIRVSSEGMSFIPSVVKVVQMIERLKRKDTPSDSKEIRRSLLTFSL